MNKILVTLVSAVLVSFSVGCAGRVESSVPSPSEAEDPVPHFAGSDAGPSAYCCAPYAQCDELAACNTTLLSLCREGFDPTNGQASQVGSGKAFCCLPTAWCDKPVQ